jgi:hypothetical protein
VPAPSAPAAGVAAQIADPPLTTIGSLLGASRPALAPPVPFGAATAATVAGGGGAIAR